MFLGRIETRFDERFVELACDLDAMQARWVDQQEAIESTRKVMAKAPSQENCAHYGRALQRGSEYLRVMGQTDASMALKSACLEVWTALDRTKAIFLVELQQVQLHLQLNQPEHARVMAQAHLTRCTASDALSSYLPFVYRALGCAAGANHHWVSARHWFEQMLAQLSKGPLHTQAQGLLAHLDDMSRRDL